MSFRVREWSGAKAAAGGSPTFARSSVVAGQNRGEASLSRAARSHLRPCPAASDRVLVVRVDFDEHEQTELTGNTPFAKCVLHKTGAVNYIS